jgi:hypothetical protein
VFSPYLGVLDAADCTARTVLGTHYTSDDLELRRLGRLFSAVQKQARAPSTLTKYAPPWRAFVVWINARTAPINPFHVHGSVVAMYLLHLKETSLQDGIGPSRVLACSAAIAYMYWSHGFPSPTDHFACAVVREAASRTLGKPRIARPAMSAVDVRLLVQTFAGDHASLQDLMHVTVLVLLFVGFMRFSDAATISVHVDLLCILQDHMKIFLRKSKTDQHMEGAWVHIARVGGPCCPVYLVERLLQQGAYVRIPPDLGTDVGPLLRPVRSDGRALQQLVGTTAKPLRSTSYTWMLDRCKDMCTRAGLAHAYTLHCGRIGGITEALANGADIRLCQLHGRWATARSRDLYIREPLPNLLSVSSALALGAVRQ